MEKFYIPTSSVPGFLFLHTLINTSYCQFFLILTTVVDMKWHVMVGLIRYFPNDLTRLSIFSWVYWPFVYLLWRNVYSDLLPISPPKLPYFFFSLQKHMTENWPSHFSSIKYIHTVVKHVSRTCSSCESETDYTTLLLSFPHPQLLVTTTLLSLYPCLNWVIWWFC